MRNLAPEVLSSEISNFIKRSIKKIIGFPGVAKFRNLALEVSRPAIAQGLPLSHVPDLEKSTDVSSKTLFL